MGCSLPLPWFPWDLEFWACPSPQVVDYYKEACRALENSETASLLGKIQKDWKKLVQMKIYYFAAVAHVSGGSWGWGLCLCSHPPSGCCCQLLPLPGAFLPLSKLSLELQSSDPSSLPAAHGETGRGAAEVWGKGEWGCVSPLPVLQPLIVVLARGLGVQSHGPCPARAWVLWGSSAWCPCAARARTGPQC